MFTRKTRALAALMAACLLPGLTACGRKQESENIDTGTVYAAEEIEYQSDMHWIDSACVLGDAVYLFGRLGYGDRSRTPGNTVLRVGLEGGGAEDLPGFQPVFVEKEVSNFTNSGRLHACPDGTLLAFEQLSSSNFLRRLDADGKMLFLFEGLNGDLCRLLDAEGQKICDLLMDGDGDIFVKADKKAGVLDPSGQLRFVLPVEGDGGSFDRLVLLGDGRVAVRDSTRDGDRRYTRLRTVDKDGKGWGESWLLPGYATVADGDANALFYYNAGDQLCAWREGAEAGEPLLSWMNAGYDGDQLTFFSLLPDGRVAVMDRNLYEGDGRHRLSVLTPTEGGTEKTVITYAVIGGMATLDRASILKFNRTNPDYQIRVKDYGDYSPGASSDAAMTRLVTEITAGKIPDIIAIPDIPVARWGAKGLLEDLWPWIDRDPDLGRDKLMTRPLEVSEVNGKLYEISDSFCFHTVAGRKDVVGDRMTWTPEDMWAALETMGPGRVPLDGTRIDLLFSLMDMDWNRFVGWENGKCDFDCEEFKELLSFCAGVPEAVDADSRAAWANDGILMLYTYYPGGFDSVQFGEFVLNGEISFVGYPNPWGEVGSSFDLIGGRSMTAACKHKEGAWAYLRTLLLPNDEKINNFVGLHGFPLNKEDFERRAENEMAEPAGGEEFPDRFFAFYSDGQYYECHYRQTTPEEYRQIMDLYDAVDTFYRPDGSLKTIITEVAGAYFAGDRSLDSAAALIQNRARLYVSEQS